MRNEHPHNWLFTTDSETNVGSRTQLCVILADIKARKSCGLDELSDPATGIRGSGDLQCSDKCICESRLAFS